MGGHSELFLDVAVFDIDPTDTYLLCSDGLYRELAFPELADALKDGSPAEVAQRLLSRCLKTAARDNVSLIIVRPDAQ